MYATIKRGNGGFGAADGMNDFYNAMGRSGFHNALGASLADAAKGKWEAIKKNPLVILDPTLTIRALTGNTKAQQAEKAAKLNTQIEAATQTAAQQGYGQGSKEALDKVDAVAVRSMPPWGWALVGVGVLMVGGMVVLMVKMS